MRRAGIYAAVAILSFCAGYGVAHYAGPKLQSASEGSDVFQRGNRYALIDPILYCRDQDSNSFSNKTTAEIEQTVGQYLDAQKRAGALDDASVYFKDLLNGPNALINSSFHSLPGSLLKVPLAITAFKKEDDSKGYLDTTVTMQNTGDANDIEHFKAPKTLQQNQTYSIRDILSYLLAYSDNTAAVVLDFVLRDDTSDVYTDLGIQPAIGTGYTIDAKTYSSFFRVLYNASYLSKASSEQLLELLSRSSFTQGLVAGVPAGTVVSHKFGEFAQANEKQLHDCGIVYKKGHPYILCIMTLGKNYDTLPGVISNVSKMVYTIVDQDDHN